MTSRDLATVDTVWSGVDWISATLAREELDDQTWLSDAFHALYDVQAKGNEYKRWSEQGYDGWGSGGCFVGSNDTHHYAKFAGKYANDAYPMLEHPKVHVSRIDLQTTVQYSTELLKEGRYQYARALHHNKGLPEHRKRRIDTYFGASGGDTVYVGSPSSDVRGRMYNKERQSPLSGYERSWRYEVVYRNQYAAPMFRGVLNATTKASEFINSQVVAWYHERGVDILGMERGLVTAISPPPEPKTDVARKLRWIRNQVVPTIRKLAELGYAEELMELIAEAISTARNHT